MVPRPTQADVSAEHVAARAAELVVEQKARLSLWMRNRGKMAEFDFLVQASEVEATKRITELMYHYALLKGYIDEKQPLKVSRPTNRERVSDDR